jgi:hypothetical protein
MKKGLVVIIFSIWELISSLNLKANNLQQRFDRMSDTVIKEIPLDRKGRPSMLYESIKLIAFKMNLDTLENGFDSLQIRLWYGYAKTDSGQLVVLKRLNHKWTAELFLLVYHLSEKGNAFKSITQNSTLREPKSGWRSFIKNLLALGIMTLPDMRKISNYPDIADGNSISVEVANINKYRFFKYLEPIIAQKESLEAKRMEQVVDLVEYEFDFIRLRKL